jgi:alkylhydroperoxidase/carboxymuconolactone decarboxylase family protein YurZ
MKDSGSVAVLNALPTKETDVYITSVEGQSSQRVPEARLQDLIPIVMVIVGGCEPCAENMVNRALQQGSPWQDIDKTLRIVANMQKLDCFAKAVGTDVVARMEKPLAAGRRALQEAISRASE